MVTKHKKIFNQRNILALLLILGVSCIFLPQVSSFNDGMATLRNADLTYVGVAIIFWLSTFFSAAWVYWWISLQPLSYGKTLLVQLASGFTNRLVPMGAGILTLNIRYLMKNKHSLAQAGTLAALNNILGFIGIVLLFLSITLLSPDSISGSITTSVRISDNLKIVAVLLLLAGLGALLIFGSTLYKKIKGAILKVTRSILQKPVRIALALMASMLITAGYAFTLYAVSLAFNAHLSLIQALLVMTFGVIAASLTPTPGGVGGAEAGLVVALISVGITPHQALITALMYRFITFWLPIVPGFVCFQIAVRKRLI